MRLPIYHLDTVLSGPPYEFYVVHTEIISSTVSKRGLYTVTRFM